LVLNVKCLILFVEGWTCKSLDIPLREFVCEESDLS
jgi:hypothetical protein